jgi:hypothetical protein
VTSTEPARHPLRRLPARGASSIRRTTTVDCVPDGTWEHGAVLTARGRDLVTDADGTSHEQSAHDLALRTDADGRLQSLDGSADLPEQLIGVGAGRGLRAILRETFAGSESSLEAALLDDLPGMQIISGYARIHGTAGLTHPREAPSSQIGVCHGWRRDGIAARAGAGLVDMLADRPVAPDLTGPEDAWHDDPPLEQDGMRRRRMVDVTPGDPTRVDAYFRDTHQPSDCPGAAPGVVRVEGVALRDIEAGVRTRLAGTAGCTHLNDLVRSLRFVEELTSMCDTATGRSRRKTEGDSL